MATPDPTDNIGWQSLDRLMPKPDADFRSTAARDLDRTLVAMILQREADEAGQRAAKHEAAAKRHMKAAEAYATAAHLLRKRGTA